MLWLILKCSFWVLLGFILLCELAAIRLVACVLVKRSDRKLLKNIVNKQKARPRARFV